MNQQERSSGGISGSTLKLIAIITMLIDHTGATVILSTARRFSSVSDPALAALWSRIYQYSRSVGRIAFPIFCFLLIEGFLHTRSPRRYAGRLFVFALLSELPFDLALKGSWYYPDGQNVYFTLLLGLLVLMGISRCKDRLYLAVPIIAAGMYAANLLHTDYSYKGVFLIAVLYLLRFSRTDQCLGGAAAISWELPAPLAFLFVWFYNGKRGLNLKYLFYWFYPVHLLILYFLNVYALPAALG